MQFGLLSFGLWFAHVGCVNIMPNSCAKDTRSVLWCTNPRFQNTTQLLKKGVTRQNRFMQKCAYGWLIKDENKCCYEIPFRGSQWRQWIGLIKKF